MEGKEVRFGVVQSGLFAGVTTTFTTGSVNSMHDSFTPLRSSNLPEDLQISTIIKPRRGRARLILIKTADA